MFLQLCILSATLYLQPWAQMHGQATVNIYWAFIIFRTLCLGLCMIVIFIHSIILLLTLLHCMDQATDVQV